MAEKTKTKKPVDKIQRVRVDLDADLNTIKESDAVNIFGRTPFKMLHGTMIQGRMSTVSVMEIPHAGCILKTEECNGFTSMVHIPGVKVKETFDVDGLVILREIVTCYK